MQRPFTRKIDLQKTIDNFGRLGPYSRDSLRLNNFQIVFNKNSTFHMNMKVDFFSDTSRLWDAGNCRFENPGQLKYLTSKSVEQFGPCHAGELYFTKLSPYTNKFGSVPLFFKKYLPPDNKPK